ncbi:LysR substrate binding domain protein [compost metagenome]
MVNAGLGVGVMPRGSAALYQGQLAVRTVTLDEPWAQRQLALCVRSEESLSSVARLLVDHLGDVSPPALAP